MKNVVYIIVFLLIVSFGHAQDIKKDCLKINQKYNATKKVSMKMDYTLYANYTTITPFQKEKGEMKRNDELMSYKVGPIETVRTEKYELVIDNDEQVIAMMEHHTKLFSWDEKMYVGNLDKILPYCESTSYTEEKDNQGCYDIKMKSGEYSRAKLYFDKKTFFITKLILFYRKETILNQDGVGKKEKPRLEITYTDIQESPVFAANEFSESKYVVKGGKNFKCIEKYKDYTLQVDLFENVVKKGK
jgi:hypothetical protein